MSAVLDRSIRYDRDALIGELESAGAHFQGLSCRCPFHNDKTPSGGVYESSDGVWRYRCHAGSCGVHGDVFDVQAKARGGGLGDVLPKSHDAKPASARVIPVTKTPKTLIALI